MYNLNWKLMQLGQSSEIIGISPGNHPLKEGKASFDSLNNLDGEAFVCGEFGRCMEETIDKFDQ